MLGEHQSSLWRDNSNSKQAIGEKKAPSVRLLYKGKQES